MDGTDGTEPKEVSLVEGPIEREQQVRRSPAEEDVKLVWYGGRISKMIFSNGKVIDFKTSIRINTVSQDKRIS